MSLWRFHWCLSWLYWRQAITQCRQSPHYSLPLITTHYRILSDTEKGKTLFWFCFSFIVTLIKTDTSLDQRAEKRFVWHTNKPRDVKHRYSPQKTDKCRSYSHDSSRSMITNEAYFQRSIIVVWISLIVTFSRRENHSLDRKTNDPCRAAHNICWRGIIKSNKIFPHLSTLLIAYFLSSMFKWETFFIVYIWSIFLSNCG